MRPGLCHCLVYLQLCSTLSLFAQVNKWLPGYWVTSNSSLLITLYTAFVSFRYLKYGQGSKRCPIQDVLESTLAFVLSTPPTSDELNSDVDMKTPISGSPTPMNTTNPTPSPCPLSEVRWSPAPRHVTESEVAVLEECLQRWRHEMEQDVKGKMQCST